MSRPPPTSSSSSSQQQQQQQQQMFQSPIKSMDGLSSYPGIGAIGPTSIPSLSYDSYSMQPSPLRGYNPPNSFASLSGPSLMSNAIGNGHSFISQTQSQTQTQTQSQSQLQLQLQSQSGNQSTLLLMSNSGPPKEEGFWDQLDLSAAGLRLLSSALAAYSHLAVLSVNGNQISWIPEAFFEWLPHLTYLDLSGNQLRLLPMGLRKLRDLETLLLHNNRLSALPWDMGRMRSLLNLRADGNPIMNVPSELIMQQQTSQIVMHLRDNAPETPPPPPRKWVAIPDGRKTSGKFRVMCYNILAEVLASPNMFYYCPSWALKYMYRKKKILEEILTHEPDILCLQEVETVHFNTFFLPELQKYGYMGIFKSKARAKLMSELEKRTVDGTATFFKSSRFECIKDHVLEYSNLAMTKAEFKGDSDAINRLQIKDNIASLLLLRRIESSSYSKAAASNGRLVLVANTHIQWNPEYADVKIMQTQILLEECTKLIAGYGGPSKVPVVLCGDFNSLPDSGVYELIRNKSLRPNHPELVNRKYGLYTKDGLQHPLSLESSYGILSEPAFTNYTADFVGCLDYIWFSNQVLAATGVLEVPEEEVVQDGVGLPNTHFPSDHVCIAADLEFLEP